MFAFFSFPFPYPNSERKYFHKALEGEQSGEGCVHVMQNCFVRISLFVVLKKNRFSLISKGGPVIYL